MPNYLSGDGLISTTIVLPCYNEAARLDVPRILEFMESADPRLHLIFVNDGSRDNTAGLIDRLVAHDPARLRAVHLASNVGKAEAVRQGLLGAIDDRADAVGYWDADLATPLHVVNEFRSLLANRPDLLWIYGSRVKMLGRRIDRRLIRHLAGRVFATAASLTLALAVYDTQCGAKLFRVDRRLDSILSTPFNSRWIFDVELLARLASLRGAEAAPPLEQCVYEAPLTEWHDVAGSKVTLSDFLKAAAEMLDIWRAYRPRARLRLE